jgi:hypothetical protein
MPAGLLVPMLLLLAGRDRALPLQSDRIEMSQVLPPKVKSPGFQRDNALVPPEAALTCEPSSLWFVELSPRRVTRLATKTYKKVYEGIFDRLS